MKALNPYSQLLADIRYYIHRATRSPKRVETAVVSKAQIDSNTSYTMRWLSERIIAADQLGHDVVVSRKEEGIVFTFVERIPAPVVPYKWKNL